MVGLALTTVGNLATTDIARDLMMDVDRHLQSTNPYLRKKAALCAIRVLRKVTLTYKHLYVQSFDCAMRVLVQLPLCSAVAC